jgi:hypothetical protein
LTSIEVLKPSLGHQSIAMSGFKAPEKKTASERAKDALRPTLDGGDHRSAPIDAARLTHQPLASFSYVTSKAIKRQVTLIMPNSSSLGVE